MTIGSPATDSIGQTCAVLKCDGDDTGGTMHFAIRTSGPYGSGDGSVIRAGTGAVWTFTKPNTTGRSYALSKTLDPSTTYYWGAVLDAGNAIGDTFTTKDLPADPPAGSIPPI